MDLAGRLSKARLRQHQSDELLILFQRGFPALNRSQFPALIVVADFQPDSRFGGLIEKNAKSLFVARDGPDQGERRGFGTLLPNRWRLDDRRFGSNRGRRRPTRR